MQTDRAAVDQVERQATFLKDNTGKTSWASVIVGSSQFLCSHCNRPFDPDEIQVAHHFARKCVGMDGTVPAYVAGEPSPARLNGTAL